jgi:hypothetical protein
MIPFNNDDTLAVDEFEVGKVAKYLAIINKRPKDYSGFLKNYSLTFGPEAAGLLKLGQKFVPDNATPDPSGEESPLFINSISYSYQDGSSFQITAEAGPVMAKPQSFGESTWQKRVENVTREGIIINNKGDGALYTVEVKGLGRFIGVNMTIDEYKIGDRVSLQINNLPQEV